MLRQGWSIGTDATGRPQPCRHAQSAGGGEGFSGPLGAERREDGKKLVLTRHGAWCGSDNTGASASFRLARRPAGPTTPAENFHCPCQAGNDVTPSGLWPPGSSATTPAPPYRLVQSAGGGEGFSPALLERSDARTEKSLSSHGTGPGARPITSGQRKLSSGLTYLRSNRASRNLPLSLPRCEKCCPIATDGREGAENLGRYGTGVSSAS